MASGFGRTENQQLAQALLTLCHVCNADSLRFVVHRFSNRASMMIVDQPMLRRALQTMRLPASLLIVVTLAAPNVASQPVPRLIFNVLHRGFNFQMYVARPGGDWDRFLLFQGETVELDIEIFNKTGVPQRVDTTGIAASGAFRLISRNGREQRADVVLSPTGHVRHGQLGGRPRSVMWGSVLDLEPDSGVTWRATIEGRGEPGIYQWQLELPPSVRVCPSR